MSNVVLACATMNMEMNPKMADLLEVFATHGLKNRKFSLIQNGSWAPQAGKRMLEALEKVPGTQIVGDMFTIKSRMKDEQEGDLEKLAQAIAESVGAVVTASEVEQHEKAPEASPLPAGFVPPVAPPKDQRPLRCGGGNQADPGHRGLEVHVLRLPGRGPAGHRHVELHLPGVPEGGHVQEDPREDRRSRVIRRELPHAGILTCRAWGSDGTLRAARYSF